MAFHRNALQLLMNPIQIKICGVRNATDARACVELGADMIGFNFYPASPRYIEPTIIRGIVDALPARTCAVGVFVDADPAEIRKLAKTAGVRCVQLHGHTTPESCSELAREFRVIRALSTDTRFEPEHTAAFPECDVLIDAYHPELRGGTGQMCDWSAARAAMRYTRFLILSGGFERAECWSRDQSGHTTRCGRLQRDRKHARRERSSCSEQFISVCEQRKVRLRDIDSHGTRTMSF